MEKPDIYGVITGDIVDSSSLPKDDREQLYRALLGAAGVVKGHYGDSVPYAPAIFSGDSWQLVVRRPGLALRVALHLRALVIASSRDQRIDTRLSIGLGTVDFIPDDDVAGGDGEAYRLSGQGLENIGKQERMAASFPGTVRSVLTEAVQINVRMLDLRVREWTAAQACAVSGAILGRTQQEIASGWSPKPISQQAVAQHLRGAAWDHALECTGFFETAITTIFDIKKQVI